MGHTRFGDQFLTPVSLLNRLRAGNNERDWSEFVVWYDGLIRRWLKRGGIADRDLEDMVQEILLELVRGVKNFGHNGRSGAFRNWLKKVVLNRVVLHFRKVRRHAIAGDFPDDLTIENTMLADQWRKEHDEYLLKKMLNVVSKDFAETTWLAFQLQTFDGVPPADAARTLGITTNAAIIAKSRVLKRLRDVAAGLVD